MSCTFRISRSAAGQIRSAGEWWSRNRPKAPQALADELQAAFSLICELPNAGEPVFHPEIANLRRILLGRVQHHIYYRVNESAGVIQVFALWHTSRETGLAL